MISPSRGSDVMSDPRAAAERLIPILEARRFSAEYAATKPEARDAILRRIPRGSTVMAGASTSLDELGVTDALTTSGDWDYLRAKIWAENDAEKRHELRRRAILADYHLGSVAAITVAGQLVAADNSGGRVSGYVSGPKNVVIVVGMQKLVPDLDAAIRRVREVAAPMEQARVNAGPKRYESRPNKWVILEGEPTPGRTHLVLVGAALGF